MPTDRPTSGIGRAEFFRGAASVGLAVGLLGSSSNAEAQAGGQPAAPSGPGAKPATPATLAENAVYRKGLPFNDTQDFDDARRGLIAARCSSIILVSG